MPPAAWHRPNSGTPKPKKKRQLQAWLPARLDAAATLAEHVAAFAAQTGEAVSRAIASLPAEDPGQALTARGRRRRPSQPAAEAKTLSATERDENARTAWRARMRAVDSARLVFVDECGMHTALTRRRARAARGTRTLGALPRNRGPVTPLLAGV